LKICQRRGRHDLAALATGGGVEPESRNGCKAHNAVDGRRGGTALDTSYGMVAPVDLTAATYRTLLLGMKQSKTYHFRIVATGESAACSSADQTLTTESLGTGLPKVTVSTKSASSPVYGGFLLTGKAISAPNGASAYILDADGNVVWAYPFPKDVTGIRMSYGAQAVWINSVNTPSGQATVHRISMDGLTDEDMSSVLAGLHHHLASAISLATCSDCQTATPS
jgi:hypothetical protein